MASHWFGDRPALNGRTGAVYLPIWARFKNVFFFLFFCFKSGRYVKMVDLFVRHLGDMKRVRRWLPYSQRFRREAITAVLCNTFYVFEEGIFSKLVTAMFSFMCVFCLIPS